MNPHNILVVDVGTQSLKASIISQNGEVLCFRQVRYEKPYLSPKEGYAEQNPDYYLDELCVATRALNEENPEQMASVKAMTLVDFRDSSVILDENGKPIRNSILWLDQRVTRLHGKNLKLWEKLLFDIVGMKDTVKYNSERTASFWLMKYEKENWEKMKTYAPIGTYFNQQITGNAVVSSADCVGHFPIDFKKGKWFFKGHPKYDVFGIPMNALPKLVDVGSVIGYVTELFSRKSMIPEGIPLYASGSDKCCETFGNGCIDKRQASISLGTACTIDVVDQKYSEPEAFLPSYQAPYKGSYDLEIQIYRGMWMVTWFEEQFASKDRIDAEKMGMSLESYLESKVKEIRPGSDGLVLQPYWGPGLKRPNAKGGIVGFSAVHTRYHIYRAILEGIAFALREGLDEIVRKTKTVPDYLVVSGGGSESNVLLQIIADVFGIEVRKSALVEASTLGGAMSVFLADGTYSTPEEAVKNMVKEGEIIRPNSESHKIYDKLYRNVYLKMYPSLSEIYRNIKYFYLENVGE